MKRVKYIVSMTLLGLVLGMSLTACGSAVTSSETNIAVEESAMTEEETVPEDLTVLESVQAKDEIDFSQPIEVVDRKGDLGVIYLQKDGSYVDDQGVIYIYDGIDTWLDENGGEWNETLKE